MSYQRENEYGKLCVSKKVIANITGDAATQCYGVVGMASQNFLKDGISELLKQENFSKGVEVNQTEEGKLIVDVYITAAYGVNLVEVTSEVQKKVRFVLETTLDVEVESVNVYIQDIKMIG